MSVCDKYFVFNITSNTSSNFLQTLQMSGEVFSPPEPSRAKFTPSGRVFRFSRPLAWTLVCFYNMCKRAHFIRSHKYSHTASYQGQRSGTLSKIKLFKFVIGQIYAETFVAIVYVILVPFYKLSIFIITNQVHRSINSHVC